MWKPWISLFPLQFQYTRVVYMWRHCSAVRAELLVFIVASISMLFSCRCASSCSLIWPPSDQYVYTVNHDCVTIRWVYFSLDGVYETFWCYFADSRKGRKTKDECPRDNRAEEENCREDSERRKNVSERPLLLLLQLFLILKRFDCGADMNYTLNCVLLFSNWLSMQKNPIDRHWRRHWERSITIYYCIIVTCPWCIILI